MKRLEQTFDADVADFERSFPPLCEVCAPKVDEIIKKKDYDAQIDAWKVFLSSGSPEETKGEVRPRTRRRPALARSLAIIWGLAVLSFLPYRWISSRSPIQQNSNASGP